MKKRYKLGIMDLYPILANKTKIEDTPFLELVFKEEIDAERLHEAVAKALVKHPLFSCTIGYERGYYLEQNEKEFELIHKDQRSRPLEFGDATNGFLWQICYSGRTVSFEWCHAVTDGRGGLAFVNSVLCHYFGIENTVETALELGLEHFYDKSEEGIPQKKQEKGHSARSLPYIKRGYKTDCHILKAPIKEVLLAAKKNDSSPAAVLPPLFSMALRRHIKSNAKNKNVCCNVVIDCRTPMQFSTMHNCILSKNITYVDRYDTMDFPLVSTIYRAILDLSVQKENIVKGATEMVDSIRPLVSIRPRFLQKTVAKLVSAVLKHSDSNFTFTYLGRLDLPEKIMDNISDINVRSWPDFGECNIAALDFRGTLILNICENYQDKRIISDFMEICDGYGIHFERTDSLEFEQANLRLRSI